MTQSVKVIISFGLHLDEIVNIKDTYEEKCVISNIRRNKNTAKHNTWRCFFVEMVEVAGKRDTKQLITVFGDAPDENKELNECVCKRIPLAVYCVFRRIRTAE